MLKNKTYKSKLFNIIKIKDFIDIHYSPFKQARFYYKLFEEFNIIGKIIEK